jgi:hypothetical protein
VGVRPVRAQETNMRIIQILTSREATLPVSLLRNNLENPPAITSSPRETEGRASSNSDLLGARTKGSARPIRMRQLGDQRHPDGQLALRRVIARLEVESREQVPEVLVAHELPVHVQ